MPIAAAGAGCFLVNPVNQTNLIQPLSRVPAGTPIVNIDSPIERGQAEAIGVAITTYIGTDNVAAGEAGAKAMAAIVSPGARVAVLAGIAATRRARRGSRASGAVPQGASTS